MRVYNLSKTARDEIVESLTKITGSQPIRSHELKIAESDDPNYAIIFDEKEKIYLGKKKDPPSYFPLLKDESMLSGQPTITVDSGAVKFVCNGANIMRPGIVKVDGDFQASGPCCGQRAKVWKIHRGGKGNVIQARVGICIEGSSCNEPALRGG